METPALNTQVPCQPDLRPPAPPPERDGRGVPPAPRTFADDGTLWDSVRQRAAALVADVRDPAQRAPLAVIAVLTGLLLFSYWPGLRSAQAAWNSAQYSHGWIVPLFSAGLLFWWWQPVRRVTASARWAGLAVLVASLGLRLLAARYRIITIDMYTFVPALAGVALLGGGWGMVRWAWPPILFLIFMYPLPDEATRYLLGPLQTLATMVSTYWIQTIGIDAIREGNQIVVGQMHLGVVDACSGLRMLTIFVALSVAIVIVGDMEWYESLVVLASAIPIALTVNAIRITLTGVMYTIDPAIAEKIFHDWAGYFMMPLALGMLYLVQRLLAALFVAEDATPAPIALQSRLEPLRGTVPTAAPERLRPARVAAPGPSPLGIPSGRAGGPANPE